MLEIRSFSSNKPPNEPASTVILGINESTCAKLDPLSSIVDPCKVDVKRRLDDAEGYCDGIYHALCEPAVDPIEDVEAAVRAEGEEVIRVDDGGDCCLAEKDELREDADGFENDGECPKYLGESIYLAHLRAFCKLTSPPKRLKIKLHPNAKPTTGGAMIMDPATEYTVMPYALWLSRVYG